jgi:hypothetical protein
LAVVDYNEGNFKRCEGVLMSMRQLPFFCVALSFAFVLSTVASFAERTEPATVTPAVPEQAVQQEPLFAFLRHYFSALAAGDVAKLASYHPTLTPQQLDTLRDYFAYTIQDLRIDVREVQVQLVANTATITFFRTDRFVDRLSGRRIEKSIRLSTALEYGVGGWHLGGLDQVAFALTNHRSQAG